MQNLAKITFLLFFSSSVVMLGSLVLLLFSLFTQEFDLNLAQMLAGSFVSSTGMMFLMLAVTNVITQDKLEKSVFNTSFSDLSRI